MATIFDTPMFAKSQIEYLFDENPSPPIEEILANEEAISSFENQTQVLMDYMTLEKYEEIMEFILQMPEESDSNNRKFRFPFVASEIFTGRNNEIKDKLFENDNQLLSKLFTLLDQEEINCVLVGYFGNIMMKLVLERQPEVLNYIFENRIVLDKLIRHLKYDSVATFVEKLLTYDEANENYIEQRLYIIDKCFQNIIENNDFDSVNNSNFILKEVVLKYLLINSGQEIFENIVSVEKIMKICVNFFNIPVQQFLNQILQKFLSIYNKDTDMIIEIDFSQQISVLASFLDQTVEYFIQVQDKKESAILSINLLENINIIMKLNEKTYFTSLMATDIYKVAFDFFQIYPRNNILHNQLNQLIVQSLEKDELREFLIEDFNVIQVITQLLAGFDNRTDFFEGHLVMICKNLKAIFQNSEVFSEFFREENWEEFDRNYLSQKLEGQEKDIGDRLAYLNNNSSIKKSSNFQERFQNEFEGDDEKVDDHGIFNEEYNAQNQGPTELQNADEAYSEEEDKEVQPEQEQEQDPQIENNSNNWDAFGQSEQKSDPNPSAN